MQRNRSAFIVLWHFVYGLLIVFGLTQSDKKQQTLQQVQLKGNATLSCPVLQEVIKKGEIYKSVTWWVCTSNVGCDGEEPGWKWIAGLNSKGESGREHKGIHMAQDGSLHIEDVHLKDVTTYQCRVTPLNGTDPKDHKVKLLLKAQDLPTANRTVKKQTKSTSNPKAAKASGGVPDYVYVMIAGMIILVFLLAAAVVYVMYQRRLLNARSNA